MKAVSIVGRKKSGKTTLGLALVKNLSSRGLKVAVLKHSHHGFDGAEGTDTEEYKKYAMAVAAYSPSESFVSWQRERSVQDLIPLLGADILIIEGSNQIGWMPRIIMADSDQQVEDFQPDLSLRIIPPLKRDQGLSEDELEILATLIMEKGFILPGLNCGACRQKSCRKLAAEIVSGKASLSGCKTTAGQASGQMEVTCNGTPLDLNPFVKDILNSGITAMLSQLKGYIPGELVIKINDSEN